jgi:hypothetical protein
MCVCLEGLAAREMARKEKVGHGWVEARKLPHDIYWSDLIDDLPDRAGSWGLGSIPGHQ